MQTYIVRQSILDYNENVYGYEILYNENNSQTQDNSDTHAANAIEEFLLQFDSDKVLEGKIAFIGFTPNLLMKNIPDIFSSKKLVIQIEDDAIINPDSLKMIYNYKLKGYKIAVKSFDFSPRFFSVLEIIDIVKLDFSNMEESKIKDTIDICNNMGKIIIAYNVDTIENFELAKKLGCNYVQGLYMAEKQSSVIHRMDHIQSNFFQLVVAVTKDEPDIDEITQIISRDVTLSFSLIKLVNSAYYALRNRVRSVQQALIILGLGQLKQWIYLLSFKKDDGQLPNELIKISFLRANFCSELSVYVNSLTVSKSEAYMLGMFSTLDILMRIPMEYALSDLSISNEIKMALIKQEGKCGLLYKLILCYEKANWKGINLYAKLLGIPLNIITQKYFECVEYVNGIWKGLTIPFDEAE